MSEQKVFFHLGLPKTASTFLQRNVFPYMKGINYIKKHDFYRLAFSENLKKEHYLFTLEMDIGVPVSIERVEKFLGFHPEAIPILFLRKHSSWIKSKYKYYIRKHGALPFDQYLREAGGELSYSDLYFMPKIKLINQYFKHPAIVFLYEELVHDEYALVEALMETLGASIDKKDIKLSVVKKSYSDKQLHFVRKYNQQFPFKSEYNPEESKIKSWFQIKPRQFGVHAVAYLATLVPDSLSLSRLIPAESLRFIEEKYAEDWKDCLDYIRKTRPVIGEY